MADWRSWESRWKEYLDGLAEQQTSDDGSGDEGPLPPGIPHTTHGNEFGRAANAHKQKTTPRPAFDSKSAARTASPTRETRDGAWDCAFCGHSHDEPLPYCEACAKFRRPASSRSGGDIFPPPRAATVDVSDEPDGDAPTEPEVVGNVKPTMQPRRPRPPGWTEAKQAELDEAAAQRGREWQEKQRQQQEKEEALRREQQQRREEEERRRRAQEQAEREERQRQQKQRQQQRQQQQRSHSSSFSSRQQRGTREGEGRTAALGRFFDSFAAFDAAYVEWEAHASSMQTLRLAEVPFPPRRDPAGLSGGDTSQHKALLRKALLRWHPDKWMALAEKIPKEEHGELGRRLSTITQALVEQKNFLRIG